jgi:deoxyribonuclease V
MKLAWSHRWDVTPAEAREIQNEARGRVILQDDAAVFHLPDELIAADVGYDRTTDRCLAALVLWSTVEQRVIQSWTHIQPSTFPYVPGLLSFREIPALLPLFESLPFRPSLILCDGQGIAHPRRIGLASHLGVVLDCPTLGWAKTLLTGTFKDLPLEGGSAVPLMSRSEQIGWAFRSRTGCNPTFVSPGHRITMAHALDCARELRGPLRLSEPARQAHLLTKSLL